MQPAILAISFAMRIYGELMLNHQSTRERRLDHFDQEGVDRSTYVENMWNIPELVFITVAARGGGARRKVVF